MEGLVFDILLRDIIIEEIDKILELPRLPMFVRDIVSTYCFGAPLKIDTILKTMKKDDISEKTKKKYVSICRETYKKSFGRSSNKFPLAFWDQMEQLIGRSCGLTKREFPFHFTYVFLKQLENI